jgi:hypothetical protein
VWHNLRFSSRWDTDSVSGYRLIIIFFLLFKELARPWFGVTVINLQGTYGRRSWGGEDETLQFGR